MKTVTIWLLIIFINNQSGTQNPIPLIFDDLATREECNKIIDSVRDKIQYIDKNYSCVQIQKVK